MSSRRKTPRPGDSITPAELRATVTEGQFQRSVIEYAEARGWRVAHFHDSRRDVGGGVMVGDERARGFPDLVLVHENEVIFVELKTEHGRTTLTTRKHPTVPGAREATGLTPEQYEWGLDLIMVANGWPTSSRPVDYFLWTPADWPEIELVLS